jgi:hypothetical protein
MAADTGAPFNSYYATISHTAAFNLSCYDPALTRTVAGWGGNWTCEMKRFEVSVRSPPRHNLSTRSLTVLICRNRSKSARTASLCLGRTLRFLQPVSSSLRSSCTQLPPMRRLPSSGASQFSATFTMPPVQSISEVSSPLLCGRALLSSLRQSRCVSGGR